MFGDCFLFLFSKIGICTIFKFWIQIWFSIVFNPFFFFFFGDCFQLMVFIYNCHLFHSLHMTFTPLNRESHDNTKRVSTTEPPRESYEEPPLRATQGSRELLPARDPAPPCGLPSFSSSSSSSSCSFPLPLLPRQITM